MAYFSTGTEGAEYEEKWCENCVRNPQECAVMGIQLLYNYDQFTDGKREGMITTILDALIPQDCELKTEDGSVSLWPGRCRMFIDRREWNQMPQSS